MIETVISVGLLGIAMVVIYALLISMQQATQRTDARSQMLDNARLAVQHIGRQVRSGNVLYDPALEGTNAGTNPDGSAIPAGFSLRIYTQANGVQRCVQWRVLNTGDLQSRSWSQNWRVDGQVSSWRQIASGVSNGTAVHPFALDASSGFGGSGNSRLVDLDLIVKAATQPASTMEIKDAMSGRNTEYYPSNSGLCSDIPTP